MTVIIAMELLVHGGGFSGFWWTLGFAQACAHHAREIVGYSSGAIVAVFVATGVPFDTIHAVETQMRAETPLHAYATGGLASVVRTMLDRALPADAHIRASERVAILAADPLDGFAPVITHAWTSRADLIESVVTSSYIPIAAGGLRHPASGLVDGFLARGYAASRHAVHVKYPRFCVPFLPVHAARARELHAEGMRAASANC